MTRACSSVADLLHELVAIPSPSGQEREIAGFVADHLARAGIAVERHGDSLLARLAIGRGPRLLLNSHLDTVPIGDGWTRHPGGEWDGDRLYGRGANDAKASAAAMIWTLSSLAGDAGRRGEIAGEVCLALTACEETTNSGMAAILAVLGEVDGSATGEPTGLEVVRAQSGLAVLRAEWSGRSCHAAHVARAEHRSALCASAADVLRASPFLTLGAEHPLLGPSTITPTVLRSGERHNVVPDRAEALFDARLAPPWTAGDAAHLLRSRMPGAAVEVRSARLRPIETAEDHPLVQAALASARRRTAVGSATLSDMALLQGVPAIKCGPGDTLRSHTPDEFVRREELEAGAAFYRSFVPRALEALAAAPARS